MNRWFRKAAPEAATQAELEHLASCAGAQKKFHRNRGLYLRNPTGI